MKKTLLILTLLFTFLAVNVFGYADITYHFNTNNVQVEAYDCLDTSCNSVGAFSGYFPDGQTTSNGELTIVYPSSLATPHGYAVFYFAHGYAPIVGHATWHTYGDDTHYAAEYNTDFDQIPNCHSTIDSFTVTNDVYAYMPLIIDMDASLDADTYSAFYETHNEVGYIPDSYKDEYYSADTRVTLYIYDEHDSLVNNQVKSYTASNGNPLYMDKSQHVEFNWIPTIDGSYTAIVQTEVIDDQCSSAIPQSASKDFTVLPALPEEECYTLLNNLKTDEPYPIAGNEVIISYDKISNHADQYTQLTAVPTDVDYMIINSDGDIVYSNSLTLAANPDTTNPTTHSFSWTPSASGWYNISVDGIANSPLCECHNNYGERVEEEIYVKAPPTYTITFQLSDSLDGSHIENAFVEIDSNSGYTNDNGQVTFSGFNAGDYHYIITHPEYHDLTGDIEVIDADVTRFLTMIPYNRPPVIEGLPDVYMDEDTVHNYIDLDDYIYDSETADSELILTFTGNTNIAVSIDPNHVLTLTPASNWVGSELITFTVSDPEGAYDSDDMLVTVDNVNDAPVIEGLPDITLDMNTHIFDAFYLGDYASDLETPIAGLTFTIVGNTNPQAGVSIGPDKKVDIQPDNDWFGTSTVTIEVSDGELTDTDDFIVTVEYVHPEIYECSDGLDNDGDGLVDLADPGCEDAFDDDESDGTSECQDGIDNDGDGLIDYLADPGCDSPQDDDEYNAPLTAAVYGFVFDDLNANGLWDAGEPGIAGVTVTLDGTATDVTSSYGAYSFSTSVEETHTVVETDPAGYYSTTPNEVHIDVEFGNSYIVNFGDAVSTLPECSDGLDNDGDGLVDLADPGCESPQDDDESDGTSECQDGIDNDGDVATDYPADFSCSSPQDNDETYPKAECQDNLDNDGDGFIDLDDPGCTDLQDNDEFNYYQCNDGIDNDGDGLIDYPEDPGCDSPEDDDEYNAPIACYENSDCGTSGFVGGNYCSGGNVVRDYITFTCVLPGTPDSYCTDSTGPVVVDYCDLGCLDGVCIEDLPECSNGLDDDGDSLIDYPEDPGCDSPEDDDESDEFIACYTDLDCGEDYFTGDNYCVAGNVARYFTAFTCMLPGTVDSYCTDSTDLVVVEYCSQGCSNGVCIPPEEEIGEGLLFTKIRLISDPSGWQDLVPKGDDLLAIITLYNNGNNDLEDLKIVVGIPELGIYNSVSRIDLDKKDTITKHITLEIPQPKRGIYDARIVVYGDNIKRIKHRPLEIV